MSETVYGLSGKILNVDLSKQQITSRDTIESKMLSAVSGVDTDEAGLDRYGERIFNLQRAILLREGWQAKDDDAPADFNFTDPIVFDPLNPRLIVPGPTEEPVSVKGNVLDRGEFEAMRKQFYALRGWDTDSGLQKAELLERLDLSDVATELEKEALIEK